MQKYIILLGLIMFSACASQPGNYAHASDEDNTVMATDSAKELEVLYPPAGTHIILSQKTQDAYGLSLAENLRKSGYALDENGMSSSSEPAPKGSIRLDIAPAATKHLSYVVDHVAGDLLRVTLIIDNETLSRVYRLQNQRLVAAGSWTRRV